MTSKKDDCHTRPFKYLRRLSDSNDFKFKVNSIRGNFDISSNGFVPTAKDLKNLTNPFYIPFHHRKRKEINKTKFAQDLFYEINYFVELLPVQSLFYAFLIKNHVFYDDFYFDETKKLHPTYKETSVCRLVETSLEVEELFEDSEHQTVHISKLQDISEKYPITLRISANASGEDIQNFLKVNSELIKRLLKYYGQQSKFSSLKRMKRGINEEIRKRNDFIYKNRKLDTQKLSTLLSKKGYDLEHKYIRRIAREEENRRT